MFKRGEMNVIPTNYVFFSHGNESTEWGTKPPQYPIEVRVYVNGRDTGMVEIVNNPKEETELKNKYRNYKISESVYRDVKPL